MTTLRKRVERRTVDPVASARRPVVVALEPGDVLAFREARRRRWYRAPIGWVFMQVVQANIRAERATKRGRSSAARGDK